MALPLLWLACLLVPQGLAQAKTCALEDDAQVLLQTDASVRPRGALVDTAQGAKRVAAKHRPFFLRPKVGKGPDHVEFGMRVKQFYGVDLPDNKFEVDMIITLKWIDQRTKYLIPAGAPNITLSQEDAQKEMWLPMITVTDRNIDALDVISTGVMIYKGGEVIKVQRLIVVVKQEFDLKEYPFDKQDLEVDIASSIYMSNTLVMVPSSEANFSEVSSSLFTRSYHLDNWHVDAVTADNGLLQKSRGKMHIYVQHAVMGYVTSHLVPAICIMLLSCGAFFFPFTAPFVTPRISLNILAYLAFTNLANASNKAIPPVHPTTWNDLFNQNIELVMIVGNILNIYAEYKHHVTKVETLAKRINGECQIIMTVMCSSITIAVMVFGAMHWSQMALDITIKMLVGLTLVGFFVFSEIRTKSAVQEKKAKEAAA